MNRRKLIVVGLLVSLLLLGLFATPMSKRDDALGWGNFSDDPSSTKTAQNNWLFSGLPEGAVIENNREDFIDILTDLHTPSDIGTHSNPVHMQLQDGLFNTMTSQNITIPEQLIEDPLNETPPYNQSAYESWQMDLEIGWTTVDHDEVSAELCVFGGAQADESLRVDIWDNGWINVIDDVEIGWNNVSIAQSLTDETLEMRFVINAGDNTSVQNSWDIDAILIHTWTTVFSSELTQNGVIQDIGNNLSRYITSVGEVNTWNEVDGTWHRYLYDPETKTVKIGNLTISHLPGGALSITGDAGTRVGRLSWYIQAYYNEIWNNITLTNYEFVGFTKTTENVTAHQRFWGPQGEMNVYLTYSYSGGFKTRVEIRNDAAQAVPIRAIWAARDVSGIQDNYELLYDEDGVLYGLQIEDATFSWYDVLVSDNPLPIQTAIDKPNRRAAVIFGNQSTVIPAGYTASIDPTYTVLSDGYDTEWEYWEEPSEDATRDYNRIGTDGSANTYEAMFRVAMTIPKFAIVTEATVKMVESILGDSCPAIIYRLDSANVGTLEGQSRIVPDTSSSGTITFTGAAGDRYSSDVAPLIQTSINDASWASGNGIGFTIRQTSGTNIAQIYDFQQSGNFLPELTVTFSAPSENWLSGYGYRQGHSIDGSTGAGELYQIKINVEYGVGTSADGTIYCNEHCDTDFDDVHITDATGNTELDYWLEEKTDSDDATFWVEVSADLGSDQIIYVYYGKTDDTSDSDGEATFLMFDNFNDDVLDTTNWHEWGGTGGTPAEADGAQTLTAASGWAFWGTYERWSDDVALGMNIKMSTDAHYTVIGFDERSYDNTYDGAGIDYATINNNGGVKYYSATTDGTVTNNARTTVYTSYVTSEIQWTGDVEFYESGVLKSTIARDPVNDMGIVMFFLNARTTYMDWVYVRNCIDTEPASNCWSAEETQPPVNDQAPTLDNPSDTDNMYAHYVKYQITVYVSDGDGFADIDYLEIGLWNDARDTEYWRGRYDEDIDTFTEEYDIGTVVVLDTGASSATKSGDDIDATFYITVDWDFADQSDLDAKCYVLDGQGKTDTDWYETTMDVETRLDWDITPSVTSDDAGTLDRGDLDEAFTVEGDLEYYGSVSSLYPSTDAVDVWVSMSEYGTNVGPWSDLTLISGAFSLTGYADDAVGQDTLTIKPVIEGAGSGGTSLYYTTDLTDTYITDRIQVQSYSASDNHVRHDDSVDVDALLWYDYDNTVVTTGTVTINGLSADHQGSGIWRISDSKSTTQQVTYDTVVASDTTHGITSVDQNSKSIDVVWDAIVASSGPAYYWTQSGDVVWFIWGAPSSWIWDYNSSAIPDATTIESLTNGTANAWAITSGNSIAGLSIGPFGASWYYANITIFSTIGGLDWVLWSRILWVDIQHSISISVFNFYEEPTNWDDENYDAGWIWFTMFTHWGNSTWTIWVYDINSNLRLAAYLDYEGMYYFDKDFLTGDDATGPALITILVNATDTGGHQSEQSRDFSENDMWLWINYTYPATMGFTVYDDYESHIVILDNLFVPVNFYTFEVYLNDSRIYSEYQTVNNAYAYNITVMNRFGDTVNSIIFGGDDLPYPEMVIFVNTYSFKFMNWYNGFLRVNVTRAGVTYSEIIMPTEIIEFNLFEETYTFSVDFLNGTTKFSQEIEVSNSTGYVITGDSLTDVFDLVNSVYAMTTAINITVESTNNYALTISIDLTNINTTINEQLIQVLLNITNTNSTLYSQTVDLLALIQNTNSTLFDQTVTIIADIHNMNTTLYAQTVTLLSNIENVNSTIYAQTVTLIADIANLDSDIVQQTIDILADISNVNSTLYAQTVWMLSNITNVNATLYAQTVQLLSDISNVYSNITAQTVTLLASIENVNSTIYAQTVTLIANIANLDSDIVQQTIDILADISNVNSTIYTQTVSILSNISNVNTTLYAQTVSLLSSIENVNSTIYAQTVTLIANIANLDSDIVQQTIDILADISNVNSTLYAQTVWMLSNITNVNTTLYAQTVTLISDISNVNATLYNQTVTILTRILNINSTIYAQGIEILTYIYNTNSTLYAQTIQILIEVDEVEDLAEAIKGLSETIKGEVADPPTPIDMSDIFSIMLAAVLVFTLVIIIVWGLRAILRDKKEGKITKDSSLDKDIDLDEDIEYK